MADLVSGWLCLEFANTLDNVRSESPYDFVPDFEALVKFALRTDVVSRSEADALRRIVAADATRGNLCLDHARALRKAIYGVFSSLAARKDAPEDDLTQLNAMYAQAAQHARVIPAGTGFDWGWDSAARPERLLWPIVRSAALLLTAPDLGRLRQCSGHNCTWMFLDRSKNRSRRWCTMEICGNRAKSRRHYERLRTS